MLKNERKNRRKAFWLTTVFYLSIIGGVVLYSQSDTIIPLLPESVQEILPEQWVQPETPADKAKKPTA